MELSNFNCVYYRFNLNYLEEMAVDWMGFNTNLFVWVLTGELGVQLYQGAVDTYLILSSGA